jgi:hypothetical protein
MEFAAFFLARHLFVCVQVARCASKYDNQMIVKSISTFLSEEQLFTHCTMPDIKKTQWLGNVDWYLNCTLKFEIFAA